MSYTWSAWNPSVSTVYTSPVRYTSWASPVRTYATTSYASPVRYSTSYVSPSVYTGSSVVYSTPTYTPWTSSVWY